MNGDNKGYWWGLGRRARLRNAARGRSQNLPLDPSGKSARPRYVGTGLRQI